MIDTATPASRQTGPEMSAPQAARLRRARWRSPQLIVGALLVLLPVVIGTRVVAGANATVPVLAAAADLSAGQQLTPELVEVRQVAVDSVPDLYVGPELSEGHVVMRDVGAGELLPVGAVADAEELADADVLRYVTLAVPTTEAPAGLRAGDVVDVWVALSDRDEADRLVSGLTVTDVDSGGALGVSGTDTTITLAVLAADRAELDELVGELIPAGRDGRVYLSRLPGVA
ncbi:SAF domain-containing protein [Phytoactinopolyspora limicola]|uniref:SAF domain-containing protein n=1 Tax=Phytoactinopolyspora limicola TaxID=2715536 RepID=UPI001FECA7F2|nr:SAF domain-containing protein [Phytoactinopolyspora limicola]